MTHPSSRVAAPARPAYAAVTAAATPPPDDPHRAHWHALGQPWRTQPEIPADRQRLLTARRATPSDPKRGTYPFSGVTLTRADVEWLLATHEEGRGPVIWDEPDQRSRAGLDLRGADLRAVNLSGLPLARLRAGLTEDEWRNAAPEQLDQAAAHLEQADLTAAHLEGAILEGTHLEDARLSAAHLDAANLSFAHLDAAYLARASLVRAYLLATELRCAVLDAAHLEGAHLGGTQLAGASLAYAHLEGAHLGETQLAGIHLSETERTRLRRWRPTTPEALPGAQLGGAFFDTATTLDDARLGDPMYGSVSLADVRWGDVNLAVVDWEPVQALGDEREALRPLDRDGTPKDPRTRLREYLVAVRANRQLAVALLAQGLNEDAARFAYRAQTLQRRVLGQQLRAGEMRKLGPWLFSWLLNLLGGYGYRMWRILAAYAILIAVFAVLYFTLGLATAPHLAWHDALLASVTAFHGRVFSESFQPGSPQAWVAACEAIAGLIVESIFIGMLAQRFFGK